MADHRSLTESVLERGEALLDCMASNSPGEEERLVLGAAGGGGRSICPPKSLASRVWGSGGQSLPFSSCMRMKRFLHLCFRWGTWAGGDSEV